MVFKFRATYDDHEDVYRDIEIKTSQTFSDLHHALQQAIGFDNSKPAFFYKSDAYWRKEALLAQLNLKGKGATASKKNGNDADTSTAKPGPLANYVNDPHQRFVYVFDNDREWTFLFELLKITEEDGNGPYPRCVKSSGAAPKQYKVLKPPADPEEETDNLELIGKRAEKDIDVEPDISEISEEVPDIEDVESLMIDTNLTPEDESGDLPTDDDAFDADEEEDR